MERQRSDPGPCVYEDVGNNLIYGRNRNWRRERRRNQVLGSLSLFKGTDFGDHNFKVGGEVFMRPSTTSTSTATKRTSFTA